MECNECGFINDEKNEYCAACGVSLEKINKSILTFF